MELLSTTFLMQLSWAKFLFMKIHRLQICEFRPSELQFNANEKEGRKLEYTEKIPQNTTSSLIIIIIITFKSAIRDFLQSPQSVASCLQHVRSSGPGAIVCKSRATHRAHITCKCHVTCHLVRRDSSAIKFNRVEIAFIWALFYWLNH